MEHNNNIEPAAVEQNEALEQPTVTEQTEVVSESIPTETEQVIAAVKAEHSEVHCARRNSCCRNCRNTRKAEEKRLS